VQRLQFLFQLIASPPRFQTGDLITQTSHSHQSKFIRVATGSDYTPIGMIINKEGKQLVIEAIEPVMYTPLQKWIDRGVESKYAVFRPRLSVKIDDVIAEAEKHLGKHYDVQFEPSDSKMYCSELIFKAYERGASLVLGTWQSAEIAEVEIRLERNKLLNLIKYWTKEKMTKR